MSLTNQKLECFLISLLISGWIGTIPHFHSYAVSPVGAPEELGRFLLYDHGCVGCHPISGTQWEKNGPPLLEVAAKLDPAWLVAWLRDPRAFAGERRMPFFGLNEDQSLAISAYLLQNSESPEYPNVDLTKADASGGERLIDEIGCLGCHVLQSDPGEEARGRRPNLEGIGSKTHPAWLYGWLKNPAQLHPETRMPNFRLSDQEALDITAFLVALKRKSSLETITFPEGEELKDLASEGKDFIEEKGCFGCHAIAGFEGMERIGSEIADWGSEDFSSIHQSGEEEDLLVPQYSLEAEAIETLAIAANLDATPSEVDETIAAGRLLIRQYNCLGCHQVERLEDGIFWGGDIREMREDRGSYPPNLHGEGKKVQPDWLRSYLSEAPTIRPWMKVRMPSFAFKEGEIELLVAYFNAIASVTGEAVSLNPEAFGRLDLEAGRMLFNGYRCIRCHPANQAMIDGVDDQSLLAPDLSLTKSRLRYEWLYDWILEPQELAPGTMMPDSFPDRSGKRNVSVAYEMMMAPENRELRAWFEEHYSKEEMKRHLEDTDWVVSRLRDYLWVFEAEDHLERFPWNSSEGDR